MADEVYSVGSESEVEVLDSASVVTDEDSGNEDIQIVRAVEGVEEGSFGDSEVEILGLQRATVPFNDIPIYLPGRLAFAVQQVARSREPEVVGRTDRQTIYNFRRATRRNNSSVYGWSIGERVQTRHWASGGSWQDEVTDEVWRQVEALENSERLKKVKEQTKYATPYRSQLEELVAQLPRGYTSGTSKDVELVCPLCGVVLGLGIPTEFEKHDGTGSEEQYTQQIQQFGCQAPYQMVALITEVDRQMSKKVYYAKCGHVYCGRCVQRIGNRTKKKSRMAKTIENPGVYAPSKCVVEGCTKLLRGGRFVEIYQ